MDEIKWGTSFLTSYATKNSKGYKITLKQFESMNLDPRIEKLLFGRTLKEWKESLKSL